MKTNEEEMRQMTVVARVAIQLGWTSYGPSRGLKAQPNLTRIGEGEFGLHGHQVSQCIGRARDEMEETTRLDRVRKNGRVNFPTRSDQLVAVIHKKAA